MSDSSSWAILYKLGFLFGHPTSRVRRRGRRHVCMFCGQETIDHLLGCCCCCRQTQIDLFNKVRQRLEKGRFGRLRIRHRITQTRQRTTTGEKRRKENITPVCFMCQTSCRQLQEWKYILFIYRESIYLPFRSRRGLESLNSFKTHFMGAP